ncbi:MAG: DUF4114 domain-containing protein [Lacipirellulaceae bacterium]
MVTRSQVRCAAVLALALVAGTRPAFAVPRSDQSPARPLGLPLAAQVHITGSDARSLDFNNTILGNAMGLVNVNLREGVEFAARGVTRLDEDRLFLLRNSDRPVRVYFLNEGAGYRNSLGYSTTMAGSTTNGARKLVLPDVSNGTFGGPNLLAPGDWVELGNFPQGTSFEFFIIQNAVNGGRTIFTNRDAANVDRLQHLSAWLLGDRYVLLGFEDLTGGGDLDYNDVVVVVDLSPDLGQGPLAILPR